MVFGIVALNFLITHTLPGDPLDALVGNFPVPPEYIEQVRRDFGLDEPLAKQLVLYFWNLLQGDFGFSFANRQPVLPLILERAGTTLKLMLPALLLASIVGVVLAVMAAARAGRWLDHGVTMFALAAHSIPVFWLGQILIIIFSVHLGWLPAQGMRSIHGRDSYLDFLSHLILPGFCIMMNYMPIITRVARTAMLEVMNHDFILTARAKGLPYTAVLWRHVLRNAAIPVITVIGYNFGLSLTGAILTETVFAWPGLGSLFVNSIANRDYPVLSGIFMLTAIAVVVANFVTDLLYAAADPRVRLDGAVPMTGGLK